MSKDPVWLWLAMAFASAEGRYRSALRLSGAIEAAARRDGVRLPERFRRHVEPWLERARAEVPPDEAARLAVEGARLSTERLRQEALDPSLDGGGSPPLSPRELEIALLIGQGLTNGEIAGRLVISKRTVESHVDHIKRKLGAARRPQIVAWAHRHDPSAVPPPPDPGSV